MSEESPNGHVNFLTFGLDQMENRGPLHRLITTTRRMDGFTATLALREVYDTQYGIFDHDAPDVGKRSPLALVAFHPQEDPYTYSMERRYMWRFRHYEIQKHWGCSLNEFLNLPFYQADDIFRIEQMLAVERNRRMEDQARQEQAMQAQQRGR